MMAKGDATRAGSGLSLSYLHTIRIYEWSQVFRYHIWRSYYLFSFALIKYDGERRRQARFARAFMRDFTLKKNWEVDLKYFRSTKKQLPTLRLRGQQTKQHMLTNIIRIIFMIFSF
jgi:hypothetical protein